MRITLADLLPGTQYVVQVRANNGTAMSAYSPAFDFTTTEDSTLPKVPTNVTWVVVGDAFYAEWDSMGENVNNDYSNIVRYEIELIGNATTKIVSVPQITESRNNYTLSFEENKSLFGTAAASVRFRVRSVDIKDLKSDWSTPITVANGVPNAPASASTNSGSGNIQVSWAASTSDDVVSYNVYNGTTAGFTPSAGNRVFSGSALTFIFTTASTAVQYFKIRAVDKFGQESTDTSTSGTATTPFGVDTTPPDAPTSVTAASAGIDTLSQQQSINVAWTASASTDVGRYEIRYANNTSGPWQVMSVGADQTSARIESLSPGWAYYVAVRAVDFFANESAWVNANNYPLTPTYDTTPPSKPAAPTAAVGTQRLQVTASANKDAGGQMEQDVDYFQVFASTTNGFTPSATNMIGRIYWGPAMVETFQIPAASTTPAATTETWYVVVKAVDKTGNVSVASNQVTAAVGLILTANIGDAQITTAKIQSLEANKITAGTGIINNLTIKSKLTLGDASTVGYIESYDYTTSGGTTGFQFSKNGLIIKTGSIEAAALKIQRGAANLIPGEYSSFELPSTFYSVSGTGTNGGVGVWSISTAQKYHGSQSLSLSLNTTTTANGYSEWIGMNLIPVTPNTEYVISYYVYQSGGAANDSQTYPIIDGLTAGGTYRAPTSSDGTNNIPSINGWVRKSWYFTTGATETAVIIKPRIVDPTTTARTGRVYYFDSIMLEQKQGSLNTPSAYSINGITQIDGGMIKTGSIQSSAAPLVINGQSQPLWAINTAGSAQFGNLLVRGTMVVGAASEDSGEDITQAGSSIESFNYVSGSTGWGIMSNGTAEFLDVYARGNIEATAVTSDTVITPSGTGGIHAYGPRGEDVALTGAGFQVLGAYEIGLTSMVSTTANKITFTTAGNHGFSAGKSVLISNVGAYAGEYTISSLPDATTFVVDKTTSTFAAVAIQGLAKSEASGTTSAIQPVLINFPTDGENPNIVSGQLSADTLSVKNSMTLQGDASVENSTVTLSQGVTTPISAPTAVNTYDIINATWPTANVAEKVGLTIGHDGRWYSSAESSDKSIISVLAYNATSNTSQIVTSFLVNQPVPTRAGMRSAAGVVYYSNRYYVAYAFENGSNLGIQIRTFDTSWNLLNTYNSSSVTSSTNKNSNLYLGFDNINNRLMIGYCGSTFTGNFYVSYLSLSSGLPSGALTSGVLMSGVEANSEVFYISHVSANTLMDGVTSNNIIFALNDPAQWSVLNTSGTLLSGRAWTSGYDLMGGWHDYSNQIFYGLARRGGDIVKYESGESYWSDTDNPKTKNISYSWYESVASKTGTVTNRSATTAACTLTLAAGHGFSFPADHNKWIEVVNVNERFNGWAQISVSSSGNTVVYNKPGVLVTSVASSGQVKLDTNETPASPSLSFSHIKRKRIQVSIPSNIPYDGTASTPNSAKVYIDSGSSATLKATISYPSVTTAINSTVVTTTDKFTPTTFNTFSQFNSPSEFNSGKTDGNGALISLKGDGSGRIGPIRWDSSGNELTRLDDTGWITPSLYNSWVHFDARTCQYRRIGKQVWIRGLVKSGTVGDGFPVFQLPADCRPPTRVNYDKYWVCASNGGSNLVTVNGGDGWIRISTGTNGWCSFDPITFLVD